MAESKTEDAIDLLQDLIGRARRAGADAADAVFFEGVSLSHGRRLGKTEKLERSEGHDLGLRVFVGRQQAVVSSSDRSPKALTSLSNARSRWPGPCPRTLLRHRRSRTRSLMLGRPSICSTPRSPPPRY